MSTEPFTVMPAEPFSFLQTPEYGVCGFERIHFFTFKRSLTANANGTIPGELTLGDKTWPTIERGNGYTFVRKGTYRLMVDYKNTDRKGGVKVKCLRFNHEGIRTHLIHDALNDNAFTLAGCIAPGMAKTDTGISGSLQAMDEIWDAIGGWQDGKACSIFVENNVVGEETAANWIQRRKAAGRW
ncbi:hypothetical protein [Marivita hallyeonensis]|uniref:DUF5675 domain-containing protein n=1 Tax=Marivita hallyeonensis TaxID=996342 RepID=A0A1M5XSS5_9RHOB|nr:hypothetical protein [Marivita hallyeonensis]SHI02861.1 hypothetical protein SAMN05443551_4118 [Marivita hallyeonensis]